MMCLSDQQFERLESRLKAAGIKRDGLYHDLLDHFYCLTIDYMETGRNFEEALHLAYQEIAPDGFSAIEQELNIFLTFNIQIRMNKVLYSAAFIAAFGQTMYVTFNKLHWPGGPAFLWVACAATLFFVIPILVHKYWSNRSEYSTRERFRFMSGIVAVGFFTLGSALKIMHLPSANVQILLGTFLFAFVFFPLYFWEQYQLEVQRAAKGSTI